MGNRFNNVVYRYKILTAKYAGGDYKWNIYRPNYTAVNNVGSLTWTNRLFHVEPTDARLSNDTFRDAEYFLVCGDSDTFAPGDYIQLIGSTDFPIITVLQVPKQHEFLGVKTGKTGQILDGGNVIYSNILFEYTVAFAQGKNEEPHISTSLNEPVRKAYMYNRPGILEGMMLQDLTSGEGAQSIWQISLVDYREKMMILHLEEPDRV